ncbi:MAG: sigma-70 family RNA polymerase sigma factor, partial [Thermomicrobiales bacterium]
LDPDIVLRSDADAIQLGSAPLMVGAQAVAERFSGGAQAAFPVLVDGRAEAAWVHQGQARVVFAFTIVDDRITAIDLIADTTRFKEIQIGIPVRRSNKDRPS